MIQLTLGLPRACHDSGNEQQYDENGGVTPLFSFPGDEMRVRVAMWMVGLLLSSIVAEASLTSGKPYTAIVDSNTRIRK